MNTMFFNTNDMSVTGDHKYPEIRPIINATILNIKLISNNIPTLLIRNSLRLSPSITPCLRVVLLYSEEMDMMVMNHSKIENDL